jgi:putative transposase
MGLRHRSSLQDYPLRFVTTTCHKWLPFLKSDACKKVICDSLNFHSDKFQVDILSYVIMINHIHLILFCEQKMVLSSFMRDVKKFSSVFIRKQLEAENQLQLVERMRFERGKQVLKTWMDRYDDFCINNPNTMETKMNYIHENPVRKGIVDNPEDYEFSSAGYYQLDKEGPVKVKHYVEALGVAGQYKYGRRY